MRIELHHRKGANDTLATGLLVGLWLGDVLATTEYWVLRSTSFGLRAFRWLLHRPAVVVAGSIAACTGFLVSGAFTQASDAHVRTAVRNLKAISNLAAIYRDEIGDWPVTLDQLGTPYLRELRVDPWGHNYALYRGQGGIAIVSAGPDGELNTADDLISIPPKS